MKARFILSTILFLFTCLFSFSQPVNNWVKDVVQQPPNAAALFKYTDVPVDYASGLPSIGVPVHSLQHGPVPVNISLSYHAQGMKVAENASWVGLGWNLSAGGQIARTVLGAPDESAHGYYFRGHHVGPFFSCPDMNKCWWLHGLVCGVTTQGWGTSQYPYVPQDLEPDLFSYSFDGYSGKFIIDKDHTIRLIDPTNDVKIEPVTVSANNTIDEFIIRTPNGIKYYFGKYSTTTAYEQTKAGASADFWRTGWMLLRAESYDGKYVVTYNYTDENYTFKSPSSGQFLMSSHNPNGPSFPGANGYDTPNHWYTLHSVLGKRLTSITTPLETITFHASTARLDLDTYSSAYAYRLDSISIATGSYCKRFAFAYDYSQDAAGGTLSYYKRLMLLSVQEKSCNNTIKNPPYTFTYNGTYVSGKLDLVNRLSKSVDHWGFYNGAPNSSAEVNVPSSSVNLSGPPFTAYAYSTANRESNQTHMLKGALKRITYPTGGYTEFDMEANVAYQVSNTITNNYLINGLTSCTAPLARLVVDTLPCNKTSLLRVLIKSLRASSISMPCNLLLSATAIAPALMSTTPR